MMPFDIFRAHFEDKPGYVYDALSYYFANYETEVSAEMVSVREARSHMLLDFIVSAVHEGKGVAMKITYPGKEIGHFLTVYGYRYLADEDNFILYFTDSDDGLHQMRQFKVEWNDDNNRWEIQYLYRGLLSCIRVIISPELGLIGTGIESPKVGAEVLNFKHSNSPADAIESFFLIFNEIRPMKITHYTTQTHPQSIHLDLL